ncbi:hypothetical protein HJC23_007860 [Cyclotella cryptica]|uniref:DUF6824 domain-containing protein n=1 Tax=Cyclotella cryptica TaxID=29204 RepID=A0ABD3QZX7_9STRA
MNLKKTSHGAAGSFSDIDSDVLEFYSKIKEEPESETKNFTFDPLPSFRDRGSPDGLGTLLDSKQKPYGDDENLDLGFQPSEFDTRLSANGSFCNSDLGDPFQSSPVSFTSKDDLEPLPFDIEPFPLTGPFADEFLTLYSLPEDNEKDFNSKVKEDSLKTTANTKNANSKDEPKKADATKGPNNTSQTRLYHYHWHPYYAMYPYPHQTPHPGYAHHYPYHFQPHPPRNYYNRRPVSAAVKDDTSYIKAEDVTDDDVICGRGGKVNNHPGNKRFRKLIHQHKLEYLRATKQEKPMVAMKILQKVKPGRFLVKLPGGFVESDDERSREKASQALREGAAKLRKDGCASPNNSAASTTLKPAAKIALPNERTCEDMYSDDPRYCDDFEPPRKKMKSG